MKENLEVKWFGRAGQGITTAASVLAEILASEGKYVQACPDLNNGKSCVSVQAYNRFSDTPLRIHSAVETPDIVVIMDIGLFIQDYPDFKNSPKKETIFIINTSTTPDSIKNKLDINDNLVYTIDADSISCCEIGYETSIPNIALMTVLIHCVGWIPMDTFKMRLQQSLSRWISPELIKTNLESVDSVAQALEEAEQTTE